MRLTFALLITTYATAAKNFSSPQGVDNGVNGPFDILDCSLHGGTDETACAAVTTADGQSCSYCTTDKDGEEAGLCVDPKIVNQIESINKDITCTKTKTSFLRSSAAQETIEGPFDELECMYKGRTDADKCATVTNPDGEPCSFCTLSEDGKESSLCVDPTVAEQLEQMNQDISCTNSQEELESSVEGPFSQLVCTIKGKTDETACAAATNNDDEPCSYCKMDKDGNEAGLCVDPEIASEMEVQNKDISCTNTDASETFTSSTQELREQPFDELKCMFRGRTDGDKCATLVNADGKSCNFCTLNEDGKEVSLCLDPIVAEQMKQVNPNVSCTSPDEELESSVEGPFSQLVCTIKGKTDETACAAATNNDDEPCSYCTKDGNDAGLCVDPEVAAEMEVQNKDISCTNTELQTVVKVDTNSFKCTIEGTNDPDKCASTKVNDDVSCEYCTMDGPLGEQGICVDPDQADELKKLAGDAMTCTSQGTFVSKIKNLSGPITDCNIDGIDHDTCLDPSKVKGAECIWCDAEIGGFCFPQTWEKNASKFLKCESSARVVEDFESDPTAFDSSNCYKVGLDGGSPDDCKRTIDDKTGENCIFCNAPRLGGIGLCMPSDFKGKEGHFYSCNREGIASTN